LKEKEVRAYQKILKGKTSRKSSMGIVVSVGKWGYFQAENKQNTMGIFVSCYPVWVFSRQNKQETESAKEKKKKKKKALNHETIAIPSPRELRIKLQKHSLELNELSRI
jgi:hypothetical protein